MVIAEAVIDGDGVVLDVWLLICRVVKLQGQWAIMSASRCGDKLQAPAVCHGCLLFAGTAG